MEKCSTSRPLGAPGSQKSMFLKSVYEKENRTAIRRGENHRISTIKNLGLSESALLDKGYPSLPSSSYKYPVTKPHQRRSNKKGEGGLGEYLFTLSNPNGVSKEVSILSVNPLPHLTKVHLNDLHPTQLTISSSESQQSSPNTNQHHRDGERCMNELYEKKRKELTLLSNQLDQSQHHFNHLISSSSSSHNHLTTNNKSSQQLLDHERRMEARTKNMIFGDGFSWS